GCTHYPFLARTISDIMGRDVVLVSSADETAFEVRSLLLGSCLARVPAPPAAAHAAAGTAAYGADAGTGGPASQPEHRWLSSGDVAWFRELGRRLLGPELDHATLVTWDEPP